MKYLLITILFVTQVSRAQTYQEAAGKCTAAFNAGLDPEKLETFEAIYPKLFAQFKQCMTGLTPPSFKVTAVDGKEYSTEDLSGKVVLVNFWFIGCPPCVAEIPNLNELSKEFSSEEVVVISFSTDKKEALEQFMKEKSIDFAVIADSKKLITDTFKMSMGYPTNLFLNKKGEIVDISVGGAMNEAGLKKAKAEMKKVIEDALDK